MEMGNEKAIAEVEIVANRDLPARGAPPISGKFSFPNPKRDMKADLTIDTDQLEAFAAGAKERQGGAQVMG